MRDKVSEKVEASRNRFKDIIGFDEFSEKQKKFLEANIFLGKMLSIGAVFHLILFLYPNTVPVQKAFAGITTSFMNFFGYDFSHYSVYIMDAGTGYEITQDCLGWKSMMAFTALMISSGGVRKNLKYLGIGLLAIVFTNFLRVVTTIHLSEAGIISFEIIHGFLWRWSLTAIVLAAWLIWFTYYRE
jgi:exosortase/archaeosortase family protein